MNNEKINIINFEADQEQKLIKALTKIFEQKNTMNIDDVLKIDNLIVTNKDHTILIQAKTDSAKIILSSFIDKEHTLKMPIGDKSEYTNNKVDLWFDVPKARVIIDFNYLKDIINIFKVIHGKDKYNNFITITTGTNSVIQLEDDNFLFMVAPGIEDD